MNELSRKSKDKYKNTNNKNHPPDLLHFCIFLKNLSENDNGKLDNLIKWLILDSCVQEFYKEGLNKLNNPILLVVNFNV